MRKLNARVRKMEILQAVQNLVKLKVDHGPTELQLLEGSDGKESKSWHAGN